MKSIVNALTNMNPVLAGMYLGMYAMASLMSTYLEGYKQMLTAKVIQAAWFKLAIRAYDKLQEVDMDR